MSSHESTPDYRRMRQLRLRTAFFVTAAIVPGGLYLMTLANIHPTSVGGLLIMFGLGLFVWRFWRDTLRMIDYLKERERSEKLAATLTRLAEETRQQEHQPPSPVPPDAEPDHGGARQEQQPHDLQ